MGRSRTKPKVLVSKLCLRQAAAGSKPARAGVCSESRGSVRQLKQLLQQWAAANTWKHPDTTNLRCWAATPWAVRMSNFSWPEQVHAHKVEAQHARHISKCSSWLQPILGSTPILGSLRCMNVNHRHTCLQVHVCVLNKRFQMRGYNTQRLCTHKTEVQQPSKHKLPPQHLTAAFGQK
jgi:hypothetical protein